MSGVPSSVPTQANFIFCWNLLKPLTEMLYLCWKWKPQMGWILVWEIWISHYLWLSCICVFGLFTVSHWLGLFAGFRLYYADYLVVNQLIWLSVTSWQQCDEIVLMCCYFNNAPCMTTVFDVSVKWRHDAIRSQVLYVRWFSFSVNNWSSHCPDYLQTKLREESVLRSPKGWKLSFSVLDLSPWKQNN